VKNTLIVISSNREMEPQTRDSVQALCSAGAQLLLERGSACVTFARCRALSLACEHLRGAFAERDVVLMLDDDMIVPLEAAQAVVDAARSSGTPHAAAYATVVKRLAAARWDGHPGLWRTGLGCVAIPKAKLFELEERSESFEMNGKAYTAFTSAGAHRGVWMGEDFRLCENLGGVRLLPIAVGHVKKWPLWPDQATLDNIAKDP